MSRQFPHLHPSSPPAHTQHPATPHPTSPTHPSHILPQLLHHTLHLLYTNLHHLTLFRISPASVGLSTHLPSSTAASTSSPPQPPKPPPPTVERSGRPFIARLLDLLYTCLQHAAQYTSLPAGPLPPASPPAPQQHPPFQDPSSSQSSHTAGPSSHSEAKSEHQQNQHQPFPTPTAPDLSQAWQSVASQVCRILAHHLTTFYPDAAARCHLLSSLLSLSPSPPSMPANVTPLLPSTLPPPTLQLLLHHLARTLTTSLPTILPLLPHSLLTHPIIPSLRPTAQPLTYLNPSLLPFTASLAQPPQRIQVSVH